MVPHTLLPPSPTPPQSLETILQGPHESERKEKPRLELQEALNLRNTMKSRRGSQGERPIFFFLLLSGLSNLALARIEWGPGDF